jgi:hypothetical protein
LYEGPTLQRSKRLNLAEIHLTYIFVCNVIKLYRWDAPQLDVQITFVGQIYSVTNLYKLLEHEFLFWYK